MLTIRNRRQHQNIAQWSTRSKKLVKLFNELNSHYFVGKIHQRIFIKKPNIILRNKNV